jgi:hypothetical protein
MDETAEETQDRADIRKQGRRAQKRKNITLSKQFSPRFWEQSDSRVAVVRAIRRRYELLKQHAGGEESYQRDLLCQRTAFISVILETQEVEAAEGGSLDMSVYVQAINCLSGLLRSLGLERRIRNVTDLSAYLEKKRSAAQ